MNPFSDLPLHWEDVSMTSDVWSYLWLLHVVRPGTVGAGVWFYFWTQDIRWDIPGRGMLDGRTLGDPWTTGRRVTVVPLPGLDLDYEWRSYDGGVVIRYVGPMVKAGPDVTCSLCSGN